MKKYVFLGSYDKTDMLIYASKILKLMNKTVLLVDTTLLKKSRYIIPSMVNERQYIASYEGIDIAIGFENFEAIEKYEKEIYGEVTDYDYVLFDIDRAIAYEKFGIEKSDLHYFVTSFDVYNLKKGVQLLAHINKDALITKVYFTKDMIAEEDDYLNNLSKEYKINWNKKNIVFFPYDTETLNAIFINQRTGRIQMKGLSTAYVDSVLFLVEEITGESNSKVKKAYKKLDE